MHLYLVDIPLCLSPSPCLCFYRIIGDTTLIFYLHFRCWDGFECFLARLQGLCEHEREINVRLAACVALHVDSGCQIKGSYDHYYVWICFSAATYWCTFVTGSPRPPYLYGCQCSTSSETEKAGY